ncbi:MAG TPA: endonuclease MutS2 [Anaerolineae bacterium]|nr:endonuclease MutS2 [Anaerolineae bacterium]
MDSKTLKTLEYPKILERLGSYAAFSASAKLSRSLRPTNDLQLALERQQRTSEARRLLSERIDIDIGGAHDIRSLVGRAERGGVLTPQELLEIKITLITARDLARVFSRTTEDYPRLVSLALPLPPPPGLIEAISCVLSEKGEVLDNASRKLASVRKELKRTHERLLGKLERIIHHADTARLLQESIITMRNGRYVVPLRAEHKRRLKSIVQDQSSSGSTLFVEPLEVVELNNSLVELQLTEREEVRRILAELSAQVSEHAGALQAIVRALAALDLAFMCAKYAEHLKAVEPIICPFPRDKSEQPDPILRLQQARHPLLDAEIVVPIDVALKKGAHALVITGPNTGGKTVTLKTVGLLVLMAQSGLHIPAQSGSQSSLFRDVFADIGDEQSIEQSLSTFSGHITNIVRILKRARRNTLVLLDELGAGTDPQEGSALARAILTYLVRRRTPGLVATHYPELKTYAHATQGVMNASVEFDSLSLQPTYHLTVGLPGRSNALAIAQRLGLKQGIIQDAREMIDPNNLRADDLLDEIHQQRERAQSAKIDAEQIRREADVTREELTRRLESIEEERQAVLESARRESMQEIEVVRGELERVRKALKAARKPREDIKPLKQSLSEVEEQVSQPVERVLVSSKEPRPLRVGDRVYLRSLKVDGIVKNISEEELEIRVGKMHVKVEVDEVERAKVDYRKKKEVEEGSGKTSYSTGTFFPSPGLELHLRGMGAEDALSKLENYLDLAYAAGMPFVRIVHGKGTGTLRQVVREELSHSPLIENWEPALEREGGTGVTVAHLKLD